MRTVAIRVLASAVCWVALASIAFAQQATLGGTVSDSSGGVLPGVTVTATHDASGNVFTTVTDEQGGYRLAVRTGAYRLLVELPGFTTINRSGIELLLNQQAVVNLEMSPSTVQETVTVTAEAPLIDTTQSRASGNVDPRQVQELPLNGRNWMDLTVLAPGSRANATSAESPVGATTRGYFQVNIDGQQVTNNVSGGYLQPGFSRDAIAEFEFLSNRFDASLGRSLGAQVNAITKSGTNTPSGTFAGYFRDDRFNAADPIAGRVLPYSNKQLSGTLGGPIVRDRVHIFGAYEYETEPFTVLYTSPWPSFNVDQEFTRGGHKESVRLDFQFNPQTRLAFRGNKSLYESPGQGGGGATNHPSRIIGVDYVANGLLASLTSVLGNNKVNEVKVAYSGNYRDQQSIISSWNNHPQSFQGITNGAPIINFQGLNFGPSNQNTPGKIGQEHWSIRDDLFFTYNAGGRHALKIGGEYIYNLTWLFSCRVCVGTIDAQGGPVPANIEELFPVWDDVSTWNLAALSPIVRSYQVGVGDFTYVSPRHIYAGWVQDDWTIGNRLTLNLGVRYDLSLGAWAEDVEFPPFLSAGRKADKNNIGPRVGFAYSLNDRTVIRGGGGLYIGDNSQQADHGTRAWQQIANPQIINDGRADFAANPFNGPVPTFDQAMSNACSVNNRAGCTRLTINSNFASEELQMPYNYQGAIGTQRQIGDTMSVQADYVYTANRHEWYSRNTNLNFNPATGANFPFTQVTNVPFPEWGVVNQWLSEGQSHSHALETAFTKRFSDQWQASATYTLSGRWNNDGPAFSGSERVTFPLAADVGGTEYTLATGDQRHRATFNGIWQLPYQFQLSGLYFFGSGERFATSFGGDRRGFGVEPNGRLRPDGTIVPRNAFVGKPIHRVDLRVQRRFALFGPLNFDGTVEVFNVFNHANFGTYTTQESSARYGQPAQNTNVAYAPRMLQLGFRLAF
jgi:hypothetical protein